jgi:hypothetical protein
MISLTAAQFYFRDPARGGLISIRTAPYTQYAVQVPAGWAAEDAIARPIYNNWAAANATQNGNGFIGQLGISRQNAIDTVRTLAQIAVVATGGVLASGVGGASVAGASGAGAAVSVPTTTATLTIGGNVAATAATGQAAIYTGAGGMSLIGGALDSVGLGTLGTNVDALLTAAGTKAVSQALGIAPAAPVAAPLAQLGTGTSTSTGTSTVAGMDTTTLLMLAGVVLVAFLALKKG